MPRHFVPRLLAASALVGLVAAFAVGCGAPVEDDCNSACVASNQCAGAPQVDCAATCAARAGVASSGDCEDAMTADTDCQLAAKDACNLAGACDDQQAAALACITTYCTANGDDANCKTLAGS